MVKFLRWIMVSVFLCGIFIAPASVVNAQDEEPEEPQNPVAVFLAEVTGTTYEEIIAFQEAGYGMGNISKAYYYIQATGGGSLGDVMAQAQSTGWGQVFKDAGLHPGGGHGVGQLFKENDTNPSGHHGKPDWAGGPNNHEDEEMDDD